MRYALGVLSLALSLVGFAPQAVAGDLSAGLHCSNAYSIVKGTSAATRDYAEQCMLPRFDPHIYLHLVVQDVRNNPKAAHADFEAFDRYMRTYASK